VPQVGGDLALEPLENPRIGEISRASTTLTPSTVAFSRRGPSWLSTVIEPSG